MGITRLPWEADQVFVGTLTDESMFAPLESGRVRLAENLDLLEHHPSTSNNLPGGTAAGSTDQSDNVHQPKRPKWSIPIEQTNFLRHSMSELGSVTKEEHELGQASSDVDLTEISLRTSSGQNSVDLDNLQFSDSFQDLANTETAPGTTGGAHSSEEGPGNADPDNRQFSSYFASIGELSDEVTGLSVANVPDNVNQGVPGEIDGIL